MRKIVKKTLGFLDIWCEIVKKPFVFLIFGVILCDPEGTAITITILVPFHRAPGKSEIPTLYSSVLRAAS